MEHAALACQIARQFCPRFGQDSEAETTKKGQKPNSNYNEKSPSRNCIKYFCFEDSSSLGRARLQHPYTYTHSMLTKNVAATTTTGLRGKETAITTTAAAMRIANTLEEIEDCAPSSHCPPSQRSFHSFPLNKLWPWRPPTRQELSYSFVSGCLPASVHVCVCAAYLRKLKKKTSGGRKNGNKIISSVRACERASETSSV